MISVSPHAYLCVEAENRCIVPGQLMIVPQDHVMAMTDVDEVLRLDHVLTTMQYNIYHMI